MDELINKFYENPHHILKEEYQLAQSKLPNYKKTLIHNNYILFVADTKIMQKLFILYLYFYEYEINQNTNRKHHIGIDLEFNNGKIALIQLSFGSHIWIIDPKDYDKKHLNILAELIFLNNKIYKIFHGGESLDVPYVYTELLNNNRDKIIQFTKRYIDTRFLCEYFRISQNERGKCSIYDGLLYFKTIDQKQYNKLNKMNDELGPTWKFMWDIRRLTKLQLDYCYYDTLYLIDFLKDIYKRILKESPDYTRTYYYIIQIIRFVLLERKNITDITNSIKDLVNRMNNYSANQETLLLIYQRVNQNIILDDKKGKIYINFIGKENYIKNIVDILWRYITYYAINKKYTIYKNKNQVMDKKLDIKTIYNKFNEIKMYKIVNLLKLFEKEISKNI